MNKRKIKRNNTNFQYLIIFCIIIVITLIISVTFLENMKMEDKKISEEQVKVEIQKQKETNMKNSESSVIINKLSEMGERDRMEYYFSQFIKAIEAKNYEQAYEMLYDDFKNNYFPSFENFESYAKKTFPKMMSVEHTNFERSGDVYVLFVEISDLLSPDGSKKMTFVVKEEELNGYIMSFSVI